MSLTLSMVVGDEHDRAALVAELDELLEALLLERDVADGEDLVDDQQAAGRR